MEICNIRDFPPFPSWYISLLSSTFLLLFDSASIYLFNFLFQHLHRWSNFIYERECNNKSGATLNCASKCLLILQIFGEYIYIYWLTYYTYSSKLIFWSYRINRIIDIYIHLSKSRNKQKRSSNNDTLKEGFSLIGHLFHVLEQVQVM